MNIKNPNFLKQLPKEARKEAFKWAFYEERILSIKLSFDFLKVFRFQNEISLDTKNKFELKDESPFLLYMFNQTSVQQSEQSKRELNSRLSSKKRNSYRVKGEMDFKSKLFGYSLATSTKWIGFGSEFTAEVKADPGNLVPHKLTGEFHSFPA